MRIRINGIYFGYISDELVKSYKEMYNINNSDHEVIKDIIYDDILKIVYEPENVPWDAQLLKEMSKYHHFDNPGQYIEYVLHSKIENKISLCMECEFFVLKFMIKKKSAGSYCTKEDIFVSPNDCPCKNKLINEDAAELFNSM